MWEDLWRGQRAGLGGGPGDTAAKGSFSDWFELNWEITNQYWSAFLKRHATGRRILECGGATGRLPLQLARQGWDCTLVDVTIEGPRLARRRIERAGRTASYVTGDVFHLPFADESFDVVYSSGLLDVLPDIRTATSEMVRALRPGGLFVAASNPRRRSIQTVAEQCLSRARQARRLLRRGLDREDQSTLVAFVDHRNDFSLEAHIAACRAAGLRDIHGHGVGLLPVIALPESLIGGYIQLTRALRPLCLGFNWWESPWTAKWGVMLAVYGVK
jgi:ubiquinone/menaquinone biosynthesis C-methylase UbiE